MIRIQRLKQPRQSSGYELRPGYEKVIEGITLINSSPDSVWVDTYKRKRYATKKKLKAKKR